MERCQYIPLRLTSEERLLLKVLENTLNVSEYTDNVDTVSRKAKSILVMEELIQIFSISSGLMLCADLVGGRSIVGNSIPENGAFFRRLFEVGRRYKIMNPDKMRSTYGKLMYLLQDSQSPTIQGQLGFSCYKEIVTVYSLLEEHEALDLLKDPRVLIATREINDMRGKKSRDQIAADIAIKRMAAAELREDYHNSALSREDIQRVLDSIADSNNYLSFNVVPVKRMIVHLKRNFDPEEPTAGFSLAIGGARSRGKMGFGQRGTFSSYYGASYGSSYFRSDSSKLSHDHPTQYTYVLQSLKLWKHIMDNMYKLWYLADQDLLSTTSTYRLWNTGQGLNRVQSCPEVGSEMRRILNEVQRECGSWVGLSVVHLGDRDVPNALMFIDKYTQVPRITAPLATCIDHLAGLFEEGVVKVYAEEAWQDLESLKMHVLNDFFKHAFDGDGDDGGSCIDGRLTSCWNWCSKISKKPFYYAFMLSGFQGFDGDWKD